MYELKTPYRGSMKDQWGQSLWSLAVILPFLDLHER
jgi:hypothetical protein